MTVSRFAPSPTGQLHIGHAWSALFGAALARRGNGRFILRIEDIDAGRCRPEFIDGIYRDLAWLGLEWPQPVRRQSDHFDDYRRAITTLQSMDLLYPCFCTRRDIQDEIERSGAAPHGPEGVLYPGTCRNLDLAERNEKMAAGFPYALRLNMEEALRRVGIPLTWHDFYQGKHIATPDILGDVVLARKDVPASYHLCVTLDDHIQGVTLVTRGDDLFYASHLHRLLQHLLGLNVPEWAHHPLLLDPEGKRFAKRNDSATIAFRRDGGKTPGDIIRMVLSALPADGPWRDLLTGF